jgi:hypothetical protein
MKENKMTKRLAKKIAMINVIDAIDKQFYCSEEFKTYSESEKEKIFNEMFKIMNDFRKKIDATTAVNKN